MDLYGAASSITLKHLCYSVRSSVTVGLIIQLKNMLY